MPYTKNDLRYFENVDITSEEFKQMLVDMANSNGDVNNKLHDVIRALMAIAESLAPTTE